MDKKRFTLVNRIVGVIVLILSSFVYLSTIEPTASFWDCGEFIASSYKLEVGHPPGNPVFNLFARFFTMFTGAEHAAVAVNSMSALCSGLTIFFLYLTIVHFGRRIQEKRGREMTVGSAVGILGAGVVGAMAYCFSDTFWFSAVEGEVYAMSSLFTAVVFWAILKWEEETDRRYADRWIILICFLMGLSIGVHLLNLLAIPPIVFIVYYRAKEQKGEEVSFWQAVGILALSAVILLFVLVGIIPYLPKLAALFDRMFVNGFGAKFNVGAVVFMVLLLTACFLGMRVLRRKDKAVLHTALLCFTTIVIGYSVFSVVIIRSCANTPTNEYQPDNPYTLIRYLGREQYGSNPLIYGETFTSPYEPKETDYYTPLNGRYYSTGNIQPSYPAGSKMLFPRMWNSFDNRYVEFYKSYCVHGMNTRKVKVGNEMQTVQMPKFIDNLAFFFDYQVNYMYIRYFMWNFVGRQNDFHGQVPGDLDKGNWESGIKFIDEARLGDQSVGPDILINNKAKNHYFFLPLILGLFGFFFQLKHDGRNTWVTGLLFLLTGLAIVVYLNQPPYQVRERDYAYAGSFYVFALWIGLGVMALESWLEKLFKKEGGVPAAAIATALGLVVPVIMGCENWDDHDRSNRYTARDMAYNYLMTVDENAILVTHGDNDTFPLWYIQEVEGVRTDVRIANTSLLGTDWYIDQMKCQMYESKPLPLSIDRVQYLYGTNDYPYVVDVVDRPILASEAIAVFRDQRYKLGGKVDFIPGHKILVPVNKENVRKYGIVSEEYMGSVVDTVELEISGDRFGKTDLMILDLLSNYDWSRPIYFIIPSGDVDLGIEHWLEYDGYSYKFVPIRSDEREDMFIDADKLYDKLMNVYKFDSLCRDDVYYDYQNLYTFSAVAPVRDIFVTTARALIEKGETDKAIAVLDKGIEVMPPHLFPYNLSWLRSSNELNMIYFIDLYLKCGHKVKAQQVAREYAAQTLAAIDYFGTPISEEEFRSKKIADDNVTMYYYMINFLERAGMNDFAKELESMLVSRYQE